MREEQPLIGKTVCGQYEILALVNQSWYADEFLCINEKRNSVFTMLVYHKDKLSDTQRKQFLEDMKAVQELKHPMLPKIEEIVEEDQYIFVIRSYIEGRSLQKEIELNAFRGNGDAIASIAEDMCYVLNDLDKLECPITLKNLKPSNVWRHPSGKLILSAFDEPRGTDITCSGPYTPGFAAPEVTSSIYDRRMDIFSLGAILFYCMTGLTLQDAPDKKPGEICPKWSGSALEYVVMQCIQASPEDRIQDYDEILWYLGQLQDPPERVRKSFDYQIGEFYRKFRRKPLLRAIILPFFIWSKGFGKEYKELKKRYKHI